MEVVVQDGVSSVMSCFAAGRPNRWGRKCRWDNKRWGNKWVVFFFVFFFSSHLTKWTWKPWDRWCVCNQILLLKRLAHSKCNLRKDPRNLSILLSWSARWGGPSLQSDETWQFVLMFFLNTQVSGPRNLELYTVYWKHIKTIFSSCSAFLLFLTTTLSSATKIQRGSNQVTTLWSLRTSNRWPTTAKWRAFNSWAAGPCQRSHGLLDVLVTKAF